MFLTNSYEYQAIQNALDKSQAIIHFKPDGTILWANANFLGAVGYTLPEIAGKHHSMFVEEAYGKSSEYHDFWASLQRGDFQAAEYRRFGKGGKEIWIQASYNPLKDKKGHVFKVVKYATDITA
jgi:methyl-accepting chemotaxis protein